MRKTEEIPTPWVKVDGRSERIKAIDSQIASHAARWFQTHDTGTKRQSEFKREDGLHLVKKFGIAVCMRRPMIRRRSGHTIPRSSEDICGYLIPIKNGEKLPMCRGCHKRVWIKYDDIVFQHDDLRVIKDTIQNFRAWRGRHPRVIVGLALFNGWARMAEEKLAMRAFYAYMPWNLARGDNCG